MMKACRQCGADVHELRADWVTPMCFACLPAPRPLPVARTHGEWRAMIERAIGLEPDPVNHTIEWCEETLVRVRELGNACRRELSNAWCMGVDAGAAAALAGVDVDDLTNPFRDDSARGR